MQEKTLKNIEKVFKPFEFFSWWCAIWVYLSVLFACIPQSVRFVLQATRAKI